MIQREHLKPPPSNCVRESKGMVPAGPGRFSFNAAFGGFVVSDVVQADSGFLH